MSTLRSRRTRTGGARRASRVCIGLVVAAFTCQGEALVAGDGESFPYHRDDVVLKEGGSLRCKVVDTQGDEIVVLDGLATRRIPSSEVKSVKRAVEDRVLAFLQRKLLAYRKKSDDTKRQRIKKYQELVRFCELREIDKRQNLTPERRKALRAILNLDPDNPKPKRQVNDVLFVDGRWWTEAELVSKAREGYSMEGLLLVRKAGAAAAAARVDPDGQQLVDLARWTNTFEAILREYRRDPDSRAEKGGELARLLQRTVLPARRSFEYCRSVSEFLNPHAALLNGDPRLKTQLEKVRDAYFGWGLATATGPRRLKELYAWCKERKLSDKESIVHGILNRLEPPEDKSRQVVAARRQRQAERLRRVEAYKAIEKFKEKRELDTGRDLDRLLDWMAEKKFSPKRVSTRLAGLIRKIFDDSPTRVAVLERRLQQVSDTRRSTEETGRLEKSLDRRVKRVLEGIAKPVLRAVDVCIAADEPGLAFDLLRYLLRINPDNRAVHKGLRHVLVDGRWYRPYEARLLKEDGLVWHDKYAWIVAAEKERYDKGDYFDLASKTWRKLEEWNKVHSNPESPWDLESEHFRLISTADLQVTTEVLKRLEGFFLQAFRQYDLFFKKHGRRKRTELIFGVGSLDEKLKVYFYRDAEQFKKYSNPSAEWAAGYYSKSKHASFFHARRGRVPVSTLQHELTHQILGELSRGGYPPSWLAEGAAVYLQDAYFRDGLMELGSLRRHGRINTYRTNLLAGKDENSFSKMLTRRSGKDWSETKGREVSKNYRGAGAVIYFLMHFDGGRYRGDVCDMLRDAYYGELSPVTEYFNLSEASLDYLMERFYKECRHENYVEISRKISGKISQKSEKYRQ